MDSLGGSNPAGCTESNMPLLRHGLVLMPVAGAEQVVELSVVRAPICPMLQDPLTVERAIANCVGVAGGLGTYSSPLHVPPSYEEGIVRGTRKLCGRADNNGYRILLPLAVEVVVAVGGPEE